MNKLLFIFGVLIILLGVVISFVGSEEVIIGEKICVDGDGDKNLEGLMCEDTEWQWFGLGPGMTFLCLLAVMLLGFIIIAIGDSYDN